MLYERWRQIARDYRNAVALRDVARGESWTFAQLAAAADSGSSPGPIAFPQGPQFILTLLRAWQVGRIVCPLEPGQKPPEFTKFPPGCVHLKSTSATAGIPRVVAFTAEQLTADADDIVATMGLRADWPNLGVISLAHSYGFSNLVLPLLLCGIPLILVDAPLPEIRAQGRSVRRIYHARRRPGAVACLARRRRHSRQCKTRHLRRRSAVPGAGTICLCLTQS